MKRPHKKKNLSSDHQSKVPSGQTAVVKMAELRKWEMNALHNSLKNRPKDKMDYDEQVMLARWELLKSQDALVSAIQAGDINSVRGFFKVQKKIPSDSLADILFASIEDGREDLVVEILGSKHPIHPKLLDDAFHLAISLGHTKIAKMIQSKL